MIVACGLSDAFRIYVPEAPFPDDKLRPIFSFLVKQLEGVARPTGNLFNRHFYLLEVREGATSPGKGGRGSLRLGPL